jgi:GGDEF domain-containing protein/PAS domain-containing protein
VAASTVGLAVIDRVGVVRHANPALFRLTGSTRGRLVRRPLLDSVDLDAGNHFAAWLDDPHVACAVDLTFASQDGDPRRLVGWVNPLAPGEGDPDDHAVVQLLPADVTQTAARSARRFDAVADDLADAVVITDPDLEVVEANRAARSLFPDLAAGQTFLRGIDDRSRTLLTEAMRTGHRDGLILEFPLDSRPHRLVARELRDSVGQLLGMAFTIGPSHGTAGPEPRRAPAGSDPGLALDVAGELLAASHDVVWLFDEDGPVAASGGARTLLGLSPEDDLRSLTLSSILSAAGSAALVSEGLTGLGPGGSWAARLDLRDAERGERPADIVLRHHPTEPPMWSITATALGAATEPAGPAEPLRDHHTGLPTELVLTDRLQLAIERSVRAGRRTCLVILGLDGHAGLSEALGDQLVEQLVGAAATTINTHVRPGDTLARTAPDRFEVVREDVSDIRDAERFAERLRAALDEPVVVDGVRWYLSASAGVALTQPGVTTVPGLRRNGRAALDRAVELGGAHTVAFGRALREGGKPSVRSGLGRRPLHQRDPHRPASPTASVEEPPTG